MYAYSELIKKVLTGSSHFFCGKKWAGKGVENTYGEQVFLNRNHSQVTRLAAPFLLGHPPLAFMVNS